MIFFNVVDEAGKPAADTGFVFLEDDSLLGQHKLFEALFFYAVRDLFLESGGEGSFFGVEGETAEVVETRPFDKIEHLIEAGVGFAWKADDKGCAEDAVGDFCS